MLNKIASYMMGYLGEAEDEATRALAERPVRTTCHDSDEDWVLLNADEENDETWGRPVQVSRTPSPTQSPRPCRVMEESWLLTPPPCFTSKAPSNLEANPMENLLIEHPSMSVYHRRDRSRSPSPPHSTSLPSSPSPQPPATQRQPLTPVTDQQALSSLENKAVTKFQKKQMLPINRNQMDRSNKVREVNSRSRRQRRSDRQHQHSGVNNNRKCC